MSCLVNEANLEVMFLLLPVMASNTKRACEILGLNSSALASALIAAPPTCVQQWNVNQIPITQKFEF